MSYTQKKNDAVGVEWTNLRIVHLMLKLQLDALMPKIVQLGLLRITALSRVLKHSGAQGPPTKCAKKLPAAQ